MIINPYSTTALTVDVLSAGLAAITFVKTAGIIRLGNRDHSTAADTLTVQEDLVYLAFWLGTVLLAIRLVVWPVFYITLHSFVSEIDGAMCIFGVRNMLPQLTRTLELVKPVLFLSGIIWLLLFRLERFSRGSDGRKSMLILLMVCSAVALFDSIGGVVLWIESSADLAVSCCTTITDIPTRFTVWVPVALFGPGFIFPLWCLYFGVTTLVICTAWVGYRLISRNHSSVAFLGTVSLLALINAVISTIAFIEVVAPQLMHKPFHHCIYCFVQKVIDGPFILGLFILGSFFLMAVLPVFLFARHWAGSRMLQDTLSSLLFYGGLFLTGSLVMVGAHLMAGLLT